ncbi:hypothetical protein [Sulfitobacter dubius]|uniref:hypothetical protein n=1 Tax=Sulfitobacter dubius TaxID=218673 RepID=UPI0029423F1B|nr:hypothetical protein [Sulfitobacter dubius]WOI28721.1 hypothetical protein R1T39_13680 [Sulfitobacter dubius]
MKLDLAEDMIVVICAFDDIPEHLFCISGVYEDCVGGYSLTGPLAGEYGEPEFDLILKVYED